MAPALANKVGIKLLIGSVSENAEGGEGGNVRRGREAGEARGGKLKRAGTRRCERRVCENANANRERTGGAALAPSIEKFDDVMP